MSNVVVTPGLTLQPYLASPRRWTFPWTTVLLVVTDAISLEMALLLGIALRMALSVYLPMELSARQCLELAAGILTLLPGFAGQGLYPGVGLSDAERLRARVFGVSVVFATLVGWDYLIQERQWSRGVLLFAYFFSLVIPALMGMWIRDWLSKRDLFGSPVALLGAGRKGQAIARLLKANPSLGLRPTAFFDDDSSKWGLRINGIPVTGPLSRANEMKDVTSTVIVAIPRLRREQIAALVESLTFPKIIVLPDLGGLQSLWVDSRDIGGVLGLQVCKNHLIPSNRTLKRAADLTIGSLIAIFSLPLIGILALLVKATSSGPAFYSQIREGYRGHTIRVWKLRTMRTDANLLLERYLVEHPEEKAEWQKHFKLRHDPRIIPGIGRYLRRFSLDELPQIWNVLKGEMSLVGPRPFPEYHLERFTPEFRRLRRSVVPGISGMWQISSRSEGDLEVQEAQDSYYIRHWSLWLDLHILLKTAHVVISGRGAY